jgi:hypothetical protein
MDVVYAMWPFAVDAFTDPVKKGDHFSANDPLVKRFPERFSPNPCFGMRWTGTPPPEMADPPGQPSRSVPVEQVTAAPGEKRTTRRGS